MDLTGFSGADLRLTHLEAEFCFGDCRLQNAGILVSDDPFSLEGGEGSSRVGVCSGADRCIKYLAECGTGCCESAEESCVGRH